MDTGQLGTRQHSSGSSFLNAPNLRVPDEATSAFSMICEQASPLQLFGHSFSWYLFLVTPASFVRTAGYQPKLFYM